MDAVAPPADDAAVLMKNLSLDSQTKTLEILDPVKKPSIDTRNVQIQPSNKAGTHLISDFMDPAMAYYPNGYPSTAYYYGGYDGSTSDWDEYCRYMNSSGLDLAHGVYGYGYSPYGAYSAASSPVQTVAHDSQLYGAHQYQYPSLYVQPQSTTTGPYALKRETTKGSVKNSVTPNENILYQNTYMNSLYLDKIYSQYTPTYCYGYGTNTNGLQSNGRGLLAVDEKFKSRVRANGFFSCNNEATDGLNELNRGPRSRITQSQKPLTLTATVVNGQDSIKHDSAKVNMTPDREQYNKADFPETYTDAKFFIIKSYSEDDVHKSIKYNVWASTQNGNKKLDAAYHEAQQKYENAPVFLFFSVNTSGQFVGVAEMVGPVDFDRSLEYWQQDKWVGCFPVKWHIVKDLPNSLLKHIILENNENKPVTNSRDTQEVNLPQGLQMIKIFKEYCSKQCVLDDFDFYEDRQKKIQLKKAKQQQFQKQAWGGKPFADKIKDGIETEVLKSVDAVSDLANEVKLVDSAPVEKKVVVKGGSNGC